MRKIFSINQHRILFSKLAIHQVFDALEEEVLPVALYSEAVHGIRRFVPYRGCQQQKSLPRIH